MKLRIAIIGCGEIAKIKHVPVILKNHHFKLVALVDPVESRAINMAKMFGINTRIFNNADQLTDCDAAVVCTPSHTHATICTTLFNRGIHVLCEKPIAGNSKDAERMARIAEDKGVILLIGHTKFYCPNTSIMRDILDGELLGTVKSYILMSGTKSQWNAANPKRYDPTVTMGGVVFENGIHWIYRILYWFGDSNITQYTDDKIDGLEANGVISCEHVYKGIQINGVMQFSADSVLENKLRVFGTNGIAEIFDNDEARVYISTKINNRDFFFAAMENRKEHPNDPFEVQLNDFACAIIMKRPPHAMTELAVKSIMFIEGAYAQRKQMDQPWVFIA